MYYDIPTQVRFTDFEGNEYGGIAWGNDIICGECGEVFDITELIWQYGARVERLSWVDVSDEILGD